MAQGDNGQMCRDEAEREVRREQERTTQLDAELRDKIRVAQLELPDGPGRIAQLEDDRRLRERRRRKETDEVYAGRKRIVELLIHNPREPQQVLADLMVGVDLRPGYPAHHTAGSLCGPAKELHDTLAGLGLRVFVEHLADGREDLYVSLM